MAALVMPKFKQEVMKALVNMLTGDIKIVLIDTGAYTFSSAHQFLSSVAAGARIATSSVLIAKTFVDGTFDADNISIAGVSGATVEAIYYILDTGSPATSPLIFWDDTLTGLVYTPNGGQVNITFNASGIFTL